MPGFEYTQPKDPQTVQYVRENLHFTCQNTWHKDNTVTQTMAAYLRLADK